MTDTTISPFLPADRAGLPALELSAPLVRESATIDTALAKLADAAEWAFSPDFSPDEAEAAGAFVEDALDEDDAREAEPMLLPMVRSATPQHS